MAYAVTGDAKYLQIIKNAYDFLQNTQCYATGGFGPSEFIATSDGGLGRALETRFDTFETGCGSWAAFKLTRYLMSFTGEARYGDWTERIFYNGIGAALPVTQHGQEFLLLRLSPGQRHESLQLGCLDLLLGHVHPGSRRLPQHHLLQGRIVAVCQFVRPI